MNNNPQNPKTQDEILVFTLERGLPVYIFLEGRFWIRFESIALWLSVMAQAILLSGETKVLLNDPAAGVYIRLMDFHRLCPEDLKSTLYEQENRMIRMIAEEGGNHDNN